MKKLNKIHKMGIQERRAREKERRRLQILVAAKRLFCNKGFSRTTMEDIASEAELSTGTLYLYFKNKNELYASMTLRVLHYLIIRMDQLHHDNASDHKGKIFDIKNALIDVYEFDPLTMRSLFLLQSSDIIKQLSAELVGEINALGKKALNSISLIFNQAIKKGICPDRHPTAIADIVWSLFSGVVMLEFSKQAIGNNLDYPIPTIETAFEIFEKGIMIQAKGVA